MSKPIEDVLCYWYAADRQDKITAVFSLGRALETLALPGDEKQANLPDCIYCELTIPYFFAEQSFLKNCRTEMDAELVVAIEELSAELEKLPPE